MVFISLDINQFLCPPRIIIQRMKFFFKQPVLNFNTNLLKHFESISKSVLKKWYRISPCNVYQFWHFLTGGVDKSKDTFRTWRWLSRVLRQGSLCIRSLRPTENITCILECTTAMNDYVWFHLDLNIVYYIAIFYICIYFVQYDVQYTPNCHEIKRTLLGKMNI